MAYNNESDRRSAVSSFYGGRKSPFDALGNSEPGERQLPAGASRPQLPSQQRAQRAERDDASSFYGGRASTELLSPAGRASAGYNRMSFFDVGREAPVKGGRDEEEDVGLRRGPGRHPGADNYSTRGPAYGQGPEADEGDDWDVYADFNNTGPRYSTAFGSKYQQLTPEATSPTPSTLIKLDTPSLAGDSNVAPPELVTVPALGAEWKRSELQQMTKKGRRELRDSGDGFRKFRAWTRDQRGICGRWGTRKHLAIFLFVICVIVAIVIAFTLPRVPAVIFASASPLLNTTTTPIIKTFSRSPANFSFVSDMQLQFDTGSNFIPIHLSSLQAKVFDLTTGQQVGSGSLNGTSLKAKTFIEVNLPIQFSYEAINDSDITWNDWYNACRNVDQDANGVRPGVGIQATLDMKILGLIGTKHATLQTSNVNCPLELPTNGP